MSSDGHDECSAKGDFAAPLKPDAYTDARRPGDWQTRYERSARRAINFEASLLAILLLILILAAGFFLALGNQTLDISIPAPTNNGGSNNLSVGTMHLSCIFMTTFFVGCVGGTMFSIKWLIHAVAKCKWHLDRRYWRFFVPVMGGVYACVLLALTDGGLIGFQSGGPPRSLGLTATYAFLVGYFSDGVSGLLSNIANAVFGTIDKK